MESKRKISIFIIAAVVIIGLVLLLNSVERNKEMLEPNIQDQSISIGAMAPLTGPAARLGEWIVQGITLAEEEINNAGGVNGREIKLIIEDDQCNSTNAVNAYNKLIQVDKVDFIVGPLCGAASVPIAPLAEKDKTVLVTIGLASINVLNAGDHVFSVLPSMRAVASRITEFAVNDLGYTKFSLIYSDDEYGNENLEGVRETLTENNAELVTAEQYARGSGDYRTILTKVKSDNSQGVILAAYPLDYAVMLKQADDLLFDKQILAVSNIQAPEVAEASRTTEQKNYYSYPSLSELGSVISFAKKYRNTYSSTATFLPMYIGSGYDGLKVLVEALQGCSDKDSTECVRDYLLQIDDYEGGNGLIAFDEKGNNTNFSSIEVRVLENGSFTK